MLLLHVYVSKKHSFEVMTNLIELEINKKRESHFKIPTEMRYFFQKFFLRHGLDFYFKQDQISTGSMAKKKHKIT